MITKLIIIMLVYTVCMHANYYAYSNIIILNYECTGDGGL